MATITTAQVGNWSDTATWVGGVVPVAGDIAILNHSVTADVDIDGVEFPIQSPSQLIIDGTSRNLSNITLNGANGNLNGFVRINNTTLLNTINISATISTTSGSSGRSLFRSSSPAKFNLSLNALISGNAGAALFNVAADSEITASGVISAFGSGNLFSAASKSSLEWDGIVSGDMVFCSAITNQWWTTLSVRGVSDLTPDTPFNTFLAGSVSGVHNNRSGQAFRPRGFLDTLRVHSGEDLRLIYSDTANNDVSLYTAGLLTGYPPEAKVEDGTGYGPSDEFTGTLEPWSPAFAAALGNNVGQYITPQVLSAVTGLP